ncbi:MAG: hypothetical protein EOO99_09560 [Pedobacter sp.]|nr:MAG: hypothetical protein EOO99_09560 [Pedobacter sp.]
MKPNSIKLQLFLLGAALLSACSGMKMASDELIQDDVYNTQVSAKSFYQEKPNKYAIDSALYQEYLAELPFDPADVDYANRINRFSYYNPWRAYYDGMYGFMPSYPIFDYSYNAWLSGRHYGYFPFYGRYGFNLGVNQFAAWFDPYAYYGSSMFGWDMWRYGRFGNWGMGFWGPYSRFDYYGGGYWNGPFNGFWGGLIGGINSDRYTSPNYGARPVRGSENGVIYTPRAAAGLPNGNPVRPNTMNTSRADRYNPQSGNAPSRGNAAPASSSRPSRGNENPTPSRPTMSNPSTPTRSNTPPPASSSGSGSSRGESSGGGRPTRGN